MAEWVRGGGFSCGAFGRLVGKRPKDDGGVVVVAADQLVELLFGVVEGGGVGPVNAPVDGDFGPDENTELVGDAVFGFDVWVVSHADEVAVELVRPVEEGCCVLLGPGAAAAHGGFVVVADATEEDGLAVGVDLVAVDFVRW